MKIFDERKETLDKLDNLYERDSQVHTLVSCERPKFLEQFLEKTKNKTKVQIANMVWDFGNNQYSKGYDQGKYNPDYD